MFIIQRLQDHDYSARTEQEAYHHSAKSLVYDNTLF